MKKLLFVATLNVGYCGLLFTLYAADEDEAKAKVASLEAENDAPCISLEMYPHGFKIVYTELPGSIEVPDMQPEFDSSENNRL